jgi:hypothetical protein
LFVKKKRLTSTFRPTVSFARLTGEALGFILGSMAHTKIKPVEDDAFELVWTDAQGHEHQLCTFCGVDCSTHPDAGNPLSCCGNCGRATCPDHRVDDAATRCVECAANFYAEERA